MSPELQQQAASFLEATKQAGANAAQFLQEQAPQYVSEVIAWQFWSNGLLAVGAVFLAVFCLWWIRKCADSLEDGGDAPFAGIVLGTIVLVFSIAMIVAATGKAVKAKVAPRVVIMEQAAKLIGK